MVEIWILSCSELWFSTWKYLDLLNFAYTTHMHVYFTKWVFSYCLFSFYSRYKNQETPPNIKSRKVVVKKNPLQINIFFLSLLFLLMKNWRMQAILTPLLRNEFLKWILIPHASPLMAHKNCDLSHLQLTLSPFFLRDSTVSSKLWSILKCHLV